MELEQFFSEENHMCNHGDRIFDETIERWTIKRLKNDELTKQAVYWLSQYLVGNFIEPLDSISELDKEDQIFVYELWFFMMKSPYQRKVLAKLLFNRVLN
ncbi:MAG: hypothetical protein QM578_23390 [Pantoea sp.]|uniref:hypothetical protein n=1 Tax=Pantoea sp. TaxID=69393 RepID=UPI0039E6E6AD